MKFLFLVLMLIPTAAHSAEIAFTVSAGTLTRIVDAICDRFEFQAGQGETKNQFAKRKIAEWIKETTVQYEADKAAMIERAAKRNAGNSEIVVE